MKKIEVRNSRGELDQHIARKVSELIGLNPVASRSYSQIQKAGVTVVLDFGKPPPIDDKTVEFGQFGIFRNQAKIIIWVQNCVTAFEAAATLVHESSHAVRRLRRGIIVADELEEEFRAFKREFLFKYNRRPALAERTEIKRRIERLYQ
jgi:hypothetical protein